MTVKLLFIVGCFLLTVSVFGDKRLDDHGRGHDGTRNDFYNTLNLCEISDEFQCSPLQLLLRELYITMNINFNIVKCNALLDSIVQALDGIMTGIDPPGVYLDAKSRIQSFRTVLSTILVRAFAFDFLTTSNKDLFIKMYARISIAINVIAYRRIVKYPSYFRYVTRLANYYISFINDQFFYTIRFVSGVYRLGYYQLTAINFGRDHYPVSLRLMHANTFFINLSGVLDFARSSTQRTTIQNLIDSFLNLMTDPLTGAIETAVNDNYFLSYDLEGTVSDRLSSTVDTFCAATFNGPAVPIIEYFNSIIISFQALHALGFSSTQSCYYNSMVAVDVQAAIVDPYILDMIAQLNSGILICKLTSSTDGDMNSCITVLTNTINDKANAFFTTNSIWTNVKTNLNNIKTTHKACQDTNVNLLALNQFAINAVINMYNYCGCEPVADTFTTTTTIRTTTAMCPCTTTVSSP